MWYTAGPPRTGTEQLKDCRELSTVPGLGKVQREPLLLVYQPMLAFKFPVFHAISKLWLPHAETVPYKIEAGRPMKRLPQGAWMAAGSIEPVTLGFRVMSLSS